MPADRPTAPPRRNPTTARPADAPRQTTYAPPPPPPQKSLSPWIPFSILLLLVAGVSAGMFYFMDMRFKELHGSLLKTNDFVVNMDKRLKKIEDDISQSDQQANQEGSSLTTKIMSLESRVAAAEKNVGWNSSRINKQISDMESVQSTVSEVSSTVSSTVSRQNSTISSNTNKINELSSQMSDAKSAVASIEALNQRVDTNTQAIETLDQHRSRMSAAMQNTQADVARLIRLYERDNPNVKRVH